MKNQQADYDCIVVGAGPAGSVAAYELARRGWKVALLEKNQIPRFKSCAGGVPAKVISLLNLQPGQFSFSPIRGLVHCWDIKRDLEISHDRELGWVVDRAGFDAALVSRAQAAGAIFYEKTPAQRLEASRSGAMIYSPAASWLGRTVIVADGASGRISRQLGFASSSRGFGVEIRLQVPTEVQARYSHRLFFDFGIVQKGYGWIFPGDGFLNLGAAVRTAHFPAAVDLLFRYAQREKLDSWFQAKRVRGAALAFPSRSPVVSGCCLAVGDAAGLVDRLTGEGIYPAVLSATLAAQSVHSYLTGGRLDDYPRELRLKIKSDLYWSVRLSRLIDWIPRSIYRRTVCNPQRAQTMIGLGLGETTYSDIIRRRFRMFRR